VLFNQKKTVEEIKNTDETIDKDELEEIVHAVGIIEKTYLEKDMENIDIKFVEKPVKYTNIFEGTADLIGKVKRKADYYPQEYWGKKIILDWKTKDSAFSDLTKWRNQYKVAGNGGFIVSRKMPKSLSIEGFLEQLEKPKILL